MSLFKSDPLLAICKLVAWLVLLGLCGSLLLALAGGAAALFGDAILRMSYPQMQAGTGPLFALTMAAIAIGLGLVIRFMFVLLAIIRSVQAGEAFNSVNVRRIRLLALLSFASIPVSLCISGALGFLVRELGPRLLDAGIHIERFDRAGFTWAQILLTLLLFVLARLFAQAAAMRDEIEGTV